jgi:hypothetical protein
MDVSEEGTVSPEVVRQIERVERDGWIDMYAAASPEHRAALGLDCIMLGEAAVFICRKIDHIQFNRLTGLGVGAPASAETLGRAIAAFDGAGVRNWIVHAAPGLANIAALCTEQGLAPHPRTWAKFLRDVTPHATATGLAVREVGAEFGAAFGEVAAKAFGMPPFVGSWLAGIVGRPGWRSFMAFDGQAPVATGSVYVAPPTAWLGIGATLASHRGRGAQSAILAARIAAAAEAGCSVLTTETGIPHAGEPGPSFKNIQRAGFRIVYERPNYWRP